MAGKKNLSERSLNLKQDGRTGSTITPSVDLPDTPTIGTASKVSSTASVTFTPATTGGPAASYTAYAYIGGVLTSPLQSGTGTTSPITVSGLSTGTTYTFTVNATNVSGSSRRSSASNSVTM